MYSKIVFVFLLQFNIVEIACSKELNKLINKTNSYTQISMNDFRHGMSDIVDEASGQFFFKLN
ncbi:hypothetical protein SFRURICE_006144 [Spodoptera frugiperda]|nr:hypothetical protein SFRURICE_006144 [Spodoptera frugiperda]